MREDLQFNIEFCEEVQQYANLYDYSRSDYCLLNRSLTDQTWEKIANKFSVNTNDCKERWKNIRGSYSKYTAKLKKFGHGTKRVKEYYLAPYLFFLDPFLKSREAKGNTNGKAVDESVIKNEVETSECEDIYENCEIVLPTDCISVRSSQSSALPNDSSRNDEPTCEMKALEAPKYDFKKRRHSAITFNNDGNHRGYEFVKKRKQLMKIKNSTKTIDPPDPDLAFLHSVLPDMKSMNSSQKRHFKIGILDLAEQILSSISTYHHVPVTSTMKFEVKSP